MRLDISKSLFNLQARRSKLAEVKILESHLAAGAQDLASGSPGSLEPQELPVPQLACSQPDASSPVEDTSRLPSACRNDLAGLQIVKSPLAAGAQDLASESPVAVEPQEQPVPLPARSQPDLNTSSPVEDRSWLSSALDKPEQLQRWSTKTPKPALPAAHGCSDQRSQDDPIQSAEVPRPVLQRAQASPVPCLAGEDESSKKGPGWRTAAHRLGVAHHRGHAHRPQPQADLISPYPGSNGQLASAATKPPGNVQASGPPSVRIDTVEPINPLDCLIDLSDPAVEPEMRKRRSVPARAPSKQHDKDQQAQGGEAAEMLKNCHPQQQPVR